MGYWFFVLIVGQLAASSMFVFVAVRVGNQGDGFSVQVNLSGRDGKLAGGLLATGMT